MGLFDFFTQDIAIDLGTANTLIIHKDKVVVDEPSIIALDRASGQSTCHWARSHANA
jgi:rod shape-determining protein MreB